MQRYCLKEEVKPCDFSIILKFKYKSAISHPNHPSPKSVIYSDNVQV